jgi:hypothetical protein
MTKRVLVALDPDADTPVATRHAIERFVVAFDGGPSTARTLHTFAQLHLFGTDADVTLLHVHDDLPNASKRLLERAQKYLWAHGFASGTTSVEGPAPHEAISKAAAQSRKKEEEVRLAALRWPFCFSRPDRERAIGAGHKFKLALEDRLLMLLMYYRLYITHEFHGFLFGIDDSGP